MNGGLRSAPQPLFGEQKAMFLEIAEAKFAHHAMFGKQWGFQVLDLVGLPIIGGDFCWCNAKGRFGQPKSTTASEGSW